MPHQLAVNPPPEVLGTLHAEIRRTMTVCSILPPEDVRQGVIDSLPFPLPGGAVPGFEAMAGPRRSGFHQVTASRWFDRPKI